MAARAARARPAWRRTSATARRRTCSPPWRRNSAWWAAAPPPPSPTAPSSHRTAPSHSPTSSARPPPPRHPPRSPRQSRERPRRTGQDLVQHRAGVVGPHLVDRAGLPPAGARGVGGPLLVGAPRLVQQDLAKLPRNGGSTSFT